MVWSWDSITFLGASLLVTVYFTVKIVESRYVASIVLEEAFRAGRTVVSPIDLEETIVIAIPEVQMESPHRQPRHLARRGKETGDHSYSARAICARVKSELAARSTNNSPKLSKETFDLMMANTHRLFTHDAVGNDA